MKLNYTWAKGEIDRCLGWIFYSISALDRSLIELSFMYCLFPIKLLPYRRDLAQLYFDYQHPNSSSSIRDLLLISLQQAGYYDPSSQYAAQTSMAAAGSTGGTGGGSSRGGGATDASNLGSLTAASTTSTGGMSSVSGQNSVSVSSSLSSQSQVK